MRKILLVIDMQNEFVGVNRSPFHKYDTIKLISAVNDCIRQYDSHDIIYITQIMKRNLINSLAPFKVFDGTENAELAKEIEVVSDQIFKKYKGDAFSNEALDRKLKELGANEVEVVGIDGGGCVALTALGAIRHGYRVTMNTKAIGTLLVKRADRLNRKLKAMGAEFI